MKKIIYMATLCCIGLLYGIEPAISQNMIQPGKSWWYQSSMPHDKVTLEPGPKVIIGLSIEESEADDPQWYPCVALDSLSNPILDTPIAWLREEGQKVWVRPNLTLSEQAQAEDSNELKVLGHFLGYWYGNEIPWVAEYAEDILGEKISPKWNTKDESEFLLYDFSYRGGETYEWPWSGESFDFSAYDEPAGRLAEGPMQVRSVGEKQVIYEDGQTKDVKAFTLDYEIPQGAKMTILDGIGAVETGNDFGIVSYVPNIQAWYGFFVAPLSLGDAAVSSIFSQMSIPTLIYVKDPYGSVIYYDSFYYKYYIAGLSEAEIESSTDFLQTYDLHGREVSSPVSGSIYIRNGKNFIAE